MNTLVGYHNKSFTSSVLSTFIDRNTIVRNHEFSLFESSKIKRLGSVWATEAGDEDKSRQGSIGIVGKSEQSKSPKPYRTLSSKLLGKKINFPTTKTESASPD